MGSAIAGSGIMSIFRHAYFNKKPVLRIRIYYYADPDPDPDPDLDPGSKKCPYGSGS